MEKLNSLLNKYKETLFENRIITKNKLNKLTSAYPFNDFEYIISTLLGDGYITTDDYLKIRNEYVKRNKYLRLFEMSPRTFGQTWCESYLRELHPKLEKASKKLDKKYDGEYDLWYKGIKIEVKASRATAKKARGKPITEKALSHKTKERFEMNFQQLKPKCCDVFIWVAVWKDDMSFWVLNRNDVKKCKHFTIQHRNENKKKKKHIFEGQIFVTDSNIKEFDCFKVNKNNLIKKIILSYNKIKKR